MHTSTHTVLYDPDGLLVLREAEGRLSAPVEGTVRCVRNRARLVRALCERLDRLEAACPQAV